MEDIVVKYSPRIYFERKPVYEKGFLTKKYLHSITNKDCDDHFEVLTKKGYCIRTGAEIPFNPEKPFSSIGYKKWAEWGNPDYKEKYCHATGAASNGKTSFKNPILI